MFTAKTRPCDMCVCTTIITITDTNTNDDDTNNHPVCSCSHARRMMSRTGDVVEMSTENDNLVGVGLTAQTRHDVGSIVDVVLNQNLARGKG